MPSPAHLWARPPLEAPRPVQPRPHLSPPATSQVCAVRSWCGSSHFGGAHESCPSLRAVSWQKWGLDCATSKLVSVVSKCPIRRWPSQSVTQWSSMDLIQSSTDPPPQACAFARFGRAFFKWRVSHWIWPPIFMHLLVATCCVTSSTDL